MAGRREFLQRAALGAAVFGVPFRRAEQVFAKRAPALPSPNLYLSNPDRYWAELRSQWLLAADRINLNCGSLGCTPLPVLDAMLDHLLGVEAYKEPDYPWFGYEEKPLVRELREALAGFLHCKRDELAIVRNATEGNNTVCNGLDLKSGDEVILTDQEHTGGRCCWEQKAARFGVQLKIVKLPRPPASVDEIVDLFARALTPRTRLLMFSHITSNTGLLMPAKEICALARQKGVLSHIDGAHAIGQIPLDLHDLGCDFYATSPHKWLLAPKGTGTLYIREENLERLWVNIASTEWRNYSLKAYRFSNVGTSNLSIMIGLKAAFDFYQAIGAPRIYQRIHQLAGSLRQRLLAHPNIRLTNASGEPFFAGILGIEPVKGDFKGVMAECAARNIRVSGGARHIRLSTHIFTQPRELDVFMDAVDRGLKS